MKIDAIICCWKCHAVGRQLYKCTNDDNKETNYVCITCADIVGLKGPSMGQESRIKLIKKEKINEPT